jgi:hypothetical protein
VLTFAFPGTTYSCVATYEGNNVEIIANEQGSFTTPSFVSFNEQERLIGEAAKNQAAMNPMNTVFDVKSVRCYPTMIFVPWTDRFCLPPATGV